MTLVRWNPDYALSRFDRLMNGFFDGSWKENDSLFFTPNADIVEKDDHITLSMELPGLDKEDVSIVLENGVLSISGERKFEKVTDKETYHLQENRYGKFVRRFTIGEDLDPEKIEAGMDKGILHVTLSKKEATKPRKIEVKVN